jgi:hypothetical protein
MIQPEPIERPTQAPLVPTCQPCDSPGPSRRKCNQCCIHRWEPTTQQSDRGTPSTYKGGPKTWDMSGISHKWEQQQCRNPTNININIHMEVCVWKLKIDRHTDKQTDKQTDRWMDGWTDGWMDGWIIYRTAIKSKISQTKCSPTSHLYVFLCHFSSGTSLLATTLIPQCFVRSHWCFIAPVIYLACIMQLRSVYIQPYICTAYEYEYE